MVLLALWDISLYSVERRTNTLPLQAWAHPFTQVQFTNAVPLILPSEAYQRHSKILPLAASETFTEEDAENCCRIPAPKATVIAYQFFLVFAYKNLPHDRMWRYDCPDLNLFLNSVLSRLLPALIINKLV